MWDSCPTIWGVEERKDCKAATEWRPVPSGGNSQQEPHESQRFSAKSCTWEGRTRRNTGHQHTGLCREEHSQWMEGNQYPVLLRNSLITCSETGLVQPQEENFWGEDPNKSQYLWGDYWEDGTVVFSTVHGRRIRQNEHKQQQQRFRLDKVTKECFPH